MDIRTLVYRGKADHGVTDEGGRLCKLPGLILGLLFTGAKLTLELLMKEADSVSYQD